MSVNFTITNSNGGTSSIQNTNTSTVYRYQSMAYLQEGATGANQLVSGRPGVLTAGAVTAEMPGALQVTASGTGLVANVAKGAAAVERSTAAGPYIVQLRAVGSVTLTAAHATLPRVDRIDLQVFDGALGDNSGTSLTRIIVTDGTAAASPTTPAAPSNTIPLATVLLPAATTLLTSGMITDIRKSAGVRGGVRVLLPGDLLADVGFMTGELRDTGAKVGASGIRTLDRWDAVTSAWQTLSILGPTDQGFARYVYTNTSNVVWTSGNPIQFDSVERATPLVVASASNSIFTIQKAGIYSITAGLRQGTNNASVFAVLDLNGTYIAGSSQQTTNSAFVLNLSVTLPLIVGDVVKLILGSDSLQTIAKLTFISFKYIP